MNLIHFGINMTQLTRKQITEHKKTLKGKYHLWRLGIEKYKSDPPIYRIHLMQYLSTRLTMYLIIFACIYSISINLWIFALIISPIGIIGNFYQSKSHLIKYKSTLLQYEIAGLIPSIKKDISNLRKKWRIIESQIGFFGLDLVFFLFMVIITLVYYSNFSLYNKLLLILVSIIPLYFIYFHFIYHVCLRWYNGNN